MAMHRVTRSAAYLIAASITAFSTPVLADFAPAGLLTPFEERRHKTFVEQARSEPIDLLFIGDSAVEFWLAEGRPEWERNYARLKAANFGVQGADTKSLLWRLENGELDHFKAKVIVVDALLSAGNPPAQAPVGLRCPSGGRIGCLGCEKLEGGRLAPVYRASSARPT
jgi:hypothetical protein